MRQMSVISSSLSSEYGLGGDLEESLRVFSSSEEPWVLKKLTISMWTLFLIET